MKNRIAIIDVGTNTFNLLIVDKSSSIKNYDIIYKERIGVGLGNKGINHAKIAPNAFKRGIITLKKFKQKCSDLNVESIRAIGTSAMRNAVNNKDFINTTYNDTGINIEVISGQQEANYIYNGVNLGFTATFPYLIMDIGGGSTEFIFANTKGLIKKQSFEIGVSRIYQYFEKPNQLNEKLVIKIENHLNKLTNSFFNIKDCNILVGSSGSFKTFYELIHNKQYPKNKYVKLDRETLQNVLIQTIYSSKRERLDNPFIIPIRKNMINISALKTLWIMKKLNIEGIIISPNSMKEGVIFE